MEKRFLMWRYLLFLGVSFATLLFGADDKSPPPELSALEKISLQIKEKADRPALLREFIRWSVQASAAEVECTEAEDSVLFKNAQLNDLLKSLELNEKKDLATREVRDALEEVARNLSQEERLRLFNHNRCIAPLYQALWHQLLRAEKSALLSDFKHWAEFINANRRFFSHYGPTESIVISPKGPKQLEVVMGFLQQALIDIPSEDFTSTLPIELRRQLVADTNTPDPQSRTEMIDILSCFTADNHFYNFVRSTSLTTVDRLDLVKHAIKRTLVPESNFPLVSVMKSSRELAAHEGRIRYFIFCGGGKLETFNYTMSPARSRLVDAVSMEASFLKQLENTRSILTFTCGGVKSKLTAASETKELPVISRNEHFVVGDDAKVKGVATFNLVSNVSFGYLQKLKIGTTIAAGYRVVEELTTPDTKAAFLEELKDADFYFPINHDSHDTHFGIGRNGGTKLRFQKRVGNVTSEIVMLVPPAEGHSQPAVVYQNEIASLFKQRRRLPEQRRLTVMSLRCGDTSCVPAWIHRFQRSLDTEDLFERIGTDNERLAREVPVTIGPQRSFPTGSVMALIEHSRYPFAALEKAARGESFGNLLDYLEQESYEPVASVDHAELSERTHYPRTAIQVVTESGENATFF